MRGPGSRGPGRASCCNHTAAHRPKEEWCCARGSGLRRLQPSVRKQPVSGQTSHVARSLARGSHNHTTLTRLTGANDFRNVARDDHDFREKPQNVAQPAGVLVPAVLSKMATRYNAEAQRENLDHQPQHRRPQQHPRQRVAELCACLQVCLQVPRVLRQAIASVQMSTAPLTAPATLCVPGRQSTPSTPAR